MLSQLEMCCTNKKRDSEDVSNLLLLSAIRKERNFRHIYPRINPTDHVDEAEATSTRILAT